MFRPLKVIIRLKYLPQNIKMVHNRFFGRIGISKLKLTKLARILLSNSPASEFYVPTQKKEYNIQNKTKV